jgi:hypothetical protein
MSRSPLTIVVLFAAFLAPWLPASADPPVQDGFLSIGLDAFKMVEKPGGIDFVFIAPGAFEELGGYEGIMIDQPEIWIDEDSPYGGQKPDKLKALADLVRDNLTGRMIRAGYNVVELPGPRVVYFRIALTDLYLRKRADKPIDYTPVDASGPDREQLRELMEKVDIIEMVLQAELVDSMTEEVLGAIVIKRGARKSENQDEQSMTFDQFQSVLQEYGARIRCRFDNGKRAKEDWIDCEDSQAVMRAYGS